MDLTNSTLRTAYLNEETSNHVLSEWEELNFVTAMFLKERTEYEMFEHLHTVPSFWNEWC